VNLQLQAFTKTVSPHELSEIFYFNIFNKRLSLVLPGNLA